jgi:hypothetical protein
VFRPEPSELPDDLPDPATTNQLELLARCEQFLRTANPTVHKELHDFLITQGHHHICGTPAFLDQLTFTLARSHQQDGAE